MENFPIEISFDKSIGEINGIMKIYVCQKELMSSISKIACAKVGITYQEKYEFINSSKVRLCMSNTVENNNVSKDTHLILTDPDILENYSEYHNESTKETYQSIMWKPLAIVGFLLSVCGLIVLITIYVINMLSIYTYGVVIDAGSTSSKIYLYYWASNKYVYNADVVQLAICKTNSSISSYYANPNQSYEEIKNCLDKSIIPTIPQAMRGKTFIYLGATAGMRMLSLNNPNASKQIMNFIQDSLKNSTLKVNDSMSDISIITGSQEGLYGWATINVLLKNLHNKMENKPNVVGALDMGGASTQITFFDQSSSNSSEIFNVKLYGNSFPIYSHSYLCYGKSQAEFRFLAELLEVSNFTTTIINPCMSKTESAIFEAKDIFNVPCVMGKFAIDHYGHEIIPPFNWTTNNKYIKVNGTSNYTSCNAAVQLLFNSSKCEHKSCTFNGVYQPEISGKFKAFSAYNFIKTILNKDNEKMGLNEYKTEMKKLCNSNFSYTLEDEWTKWKCFDVVFMIQMLINLGFNESNWSNIDFVDKISGSNVGWALGYMVNKTSVISKEKPFLPIEDYLFGILFVVLLIIMCFAIVFTYFFCVRNRRNKKYVDNSEVTEEENLLS